MVSSAEGRSECIVLQVRGGAPRAQAVGNLLGLHVGLVIVVGGMVDVDGGSIGVGEVVVVAVVRGSVDVKDVIVVIVGGGVVGVEDVVGVEVEVRRWVGGVGDEWMEDGGCWREKVCWWRLGQWCSIA